MFPVSLRVLRSMPRPFLVLLGGVVVNRVATFIVPYLSVLLHRHYGFSDAGTGLVILAYGTGTVISILAGGILTDALGRRRTLLLSLFGGGALAAAVPFMPTRGLFVAALLAYGFVGDLYRPAVSAVLADLLPPERRAAGFAALRTAFNFGWAIGIGLGGLLEPFGPTVMFVGDGITTALFGVVVLVGLPETRGEAPAPGLSPAIIVRSLAGDGILRRTLLVSLAWAVLIVSWMTVFPLTVVEAPGGLAWMFGLTMGFNGILCALFQIPVTEAVRGRRLRVAALGMLLGGASIAGLGFARGLPAWLALMAAYTAGEMLVIPALQAFLLDHAPADRRGTWVALQQSVFSLVFAVAPVALLPMRRAAGDAWYWPGLLLVALPGAALLLALDRSDSGPLQHAAPPPVPLDPDESPLP